MPRPSNPARVLAALAALLSAALASDAGARPRRRPHVHPDWATHPSARHAALDRARCLAELRRRGVAFREAPSARGVEAPIRLAGPIGGVEVSTGAPEHVRAASPHEVLDCRLALSLHDFSKVLREHGVDALRVASVWRPHGSGAPGTRHPAALAVDVTALGRPGPGGARTWIEVERDFPVRRGAPPCGSGAPPLPEGASEPARTLLSVVCAAADAHLFTSILTPNLDRAHADHLHLEITPRVRWSLVR